MNLKLQRNPYFAKKDQKCNKTTDYLWKTAQNEQNIGRFGQISNLKGIRDPTLKDGFRDTHFSIPTQLVSNSAFEAQCTFKTNRWNTRNIDTRNGEFV